MEFVRCGGTSLNSLNRGTVTCLNSLTFIRSHLSFVPDFSFSVWRLPACRCHLTPSVVPSRTVHDGCHIVPHGWCRVGCHGSAPSSSLYYLYPTYSSLTHCNCVWTYGFVTHRSQHTGRVTDLWLPNPGDIFSFLVSKLGRVHVYPKSPFLKAKLSILRPFLRRMCLVMVSLCT